MPSKTSWGVLRGYICARKGTRRERRGNRVLHRWNSSTRWRRHHHPDRVYHTSAQKLRQIPASAEPRDLVGHVLAPIPPFDKGGNRGIYKVWRLTKSSLVILRSRSTSIRLTPQPQEAVTDNLAYAPDGPSAADLAMNQPLPEFHPDSELPSL